MKAWAAGSNEPATWAIDITDTSTALQTTGAIGYRSYLSSGDLNSPISLSVSNLTARPGQLNRYPPFMPLWWRQSGAVTVVPCGRPLPAGTVFSCADIRPEDRTTKDND